MVDAAAETASALTKRSALRRPNDAAALPAAEPAALNFFIVWTTKCVIHNAVRNAAHATTNGQAGDATNADKVHVPAAARKALLIQAVQ